ncbi:MAG: class I SAM-dependent methyltransferase [Nitrososphaerales archaeon]
MKPFDELIAEAESLPFEGWDFSCLAGRLVESPAPWDYQKIVSGLLPGVDSLLDLGTGGGELLSSFAPFPHYTVATEGYPPNVSVAKRKLQPLGMEVIETYCDDNDKLPQRGALPFRNSSIDLIVNRHESFIASEVFRVLKPSGRFVTQQVGGSYSPELREAFGVTESTTLTGWDLREAVEQIEGAGFKVTDSQEATLETRFLDVGAVVYYLKALPYEIPGFSTKRYYGRLRELDQAIRRDESFRVTLPCFLVQAFKT